MITSLTEMLELPNIGYMTTFTFYIEPCDTCIDRQIDRQIERQIDR